MEEYNTVEEYVYESREELKRVEHIIYVSLKYTRTTDVLRNALLRFVSFWDMIIQAHLIKAQDDGKIEKMPRSPALKATKFAEIYPEMQEIQKFIHFYFFIKDLLKRDYGKINEYRRHVGMVFILENRSVIINIDNLETCEFYAYLFYDFSRKFLGLVQDED